ncbi:MAG: nuclease-related domain-containing protein, partial [bacterium]
PRAALGVSGVGFLAAAIFLLWAVRDGFKGIGSFFKGARGEESVAVLLAALPRGFHVFHDVLCGCAGGIDHVVVGPNGVFVIETKCWAGPVTFEAGAILADGQLPSRPPIAQARASAHALSLFLQDKLESVPACVPVVCFASNTFKAELLTCGDTLICNATALQTLIVTCACHLSQDEIERIVKVMEPKES